MKKIIYLASIIFLLFSCTKEVKIDIPGYEEKIVVDGSIEVGQPPIVLLSNTKDIYSPTDLDSYLKGFISDATVTVNNGNTTVTLDKVCTDELIPGTESIAAELFGIPADKLKNYHLCAYTTFNISMFGEVGKTYTLNIDYKGKSYTSTTAILEPKSLDSIYWKPDYGLTDYGYSWAKISDDINTYGAYLWEVKRINTQSNGKPKDEFFSKPFTPVFDDEFINGKTFDFFFENPMTFRDESMDEKYRGLFKKGDSLVIKFSRMEKPIYTFLEKKYVQLSTQGNPFATPVNIPSNITGGALGLWAGYSAVFDTLYCE